MIGIYSILVQLWHRRSQRLWRTETSWVRSHYSFQGDFMSLPVTSTLKYNAFPDFFSILVIFLDGRFQILPTDGTRRPITAINYGWRNLQSMNIGGWTIRVELCSWVLDFSSPLTTVFNGVSKLIPKSSTMRTMASLNLCGFMESHYWKSLKNEFFKILVPELE